MTSGRYVAHWTGDNDATWADLKFSLSAMISFNIFGIKMIGNDVCGFRGVTSEDLCVRWHQIGALLNSFFRNHNTLGAPDQHPTVFSQTGQSRIRDAIRRRYRLFPYLYHVLRSNGMYISPVIWQPGFRTLSKADYIKYSSSDSEFMLGSSLLICANFNPPPQSTTKCLFPIGKWCSIVHKNECIDIRNPQQLAITVNDNVGSDVFQMEGTVVPMAIEAGKTITQVRD